MEDSQMLREDFDKTLDEDISESNYQKLENPTLQDYLRGNNIENIDERYNITIDDLFRNFGMKHLTGYDAKFFDNKEAILANKALRGYLKESKKEAKREINKLFENNGGILYNLLLNEVANEYESIESEMIIIASYIIEYLFQHPNESKEILRTQYEDMINRIKIKSESIDNKQFDKIKNIIKERFDNIVIPLFDKVEKNHFEDQKDFRNQFAEAIGKLQKLALINKNTSYIILKAFPEDSLDFSSYVVKEEDIANNDLEVENQEKYDNYKDNKEVSSIPDIFNNVFTTSNCFNNDWWNEDENTCWTEYNKSMSEIRDNKSSNTTKIEANIYTSPLAFGGAIFKGVSLAFSSLGKAIDIAANPLLEIDDGVSKLFGSILKAISIPLKTLATITNFISNIFMTSANLIIDNLKEKEKFNTTTKEVIYIKSQNILKNKINKIQEDIINSETQIRKNKDQLLDLEKSEEEKTELQNKISKESLSLLNKKEKYLKRYNKFKEINEKIKKYEEKTINLSSIEKKSKEQKHVNMLSQERNESMQQRT